MRPVIDTSTFQYWGCCSLGKRTKCFLCNGRDFIFGDDGAFCKAAVHAHAEGCEGRELTGSYQVADLSQRDCRREAFLLVYDELLHLRIIIGQAGAGSDAPAQQTAILGSKDVGVPGFVTVLRK